ncbi:MAG: Na/Pi-cotransporter II-related protein [Bacteroidetes bacterium]|nr:Na/Pi-cotransporter II-related protein [Bacteroidota bacterium]
MTERKPEIGERLIAMVIDNMLMSILALLAAVPNFISVTKQLAKHGDDPASAHIVLFGSPLWYLSLAGLALYFWKDSFNGRSIAKRFLYYQVVHNQTGIAANPLRCVVRNLTFFLWPVEIIMVIVNPSRRLGDMLAGTRVAVYDDKAPRIPTRWGSLLLSFMLAYVVAVVLTVPLLKVQKMLNTPPALPYIKSSYNNEESRDLTALVENKVGEYVQSSIRVYDKMEKDNSKYIACEFRWIGSYDDNEDARDSLCGIVENMIRTKYPQGTYQGHAKFIYPAGSDREPITIPLGIGRLELKESEEPEEMKPKKNGTATKDSVYVL